LRSGALLLYRRGDRLACLADLAHDLAQRADGSYRLCGRGLNCGYLFCDFTGRLAGLSGEALHLRGNHSEAVSGLAGGRPCPGVSRAERASGV
jgi:hypothetical protein